jgi:hypothetical protein
LLKTIPCGGSWSLIVEIDRVIDERGQVRTMSLSGEAKVNRLLRTKTPFAERLNASTEPRNSGYWIGLKVWRRSPWS